MQTKLRTFIDIFSGEIEKIVIPMIQRDYAQGRQTTAVNKIRERFLQSLYEGIEGNTPIVLDFVYGDVKEGILTLLDGQQRLTTLFLLHWYFAKRENIEEEGRIGKFYEKACLVEQIYVKDDSMTVGKYVAATAKELGADISLTGFFRFEKGEGIQKREENFAEEIAKMTAGK